MSFDVFSRSLSNFWLYEFCLPSIVFVELLSHYCLLSSLPHPLTLVFSLFCLTLKWGHLHFSLCFRHIFVVPRLLFCLFFIWGSFCLLYVLPYLIALLSALLLLWNYRFAVACSGQCLILLYCMLLTSTCPAGKVRERIAPLETLVRRLYHLSKKDQGLLEPTEIALCTIAVRKQHLGAIT